MMLARHWWLAAFLNATLLPAGGGKVLAACPAQEASLCLPQQWAETVQTRTEALDAGRFSATTRFSGKNTFVIGGNRFTGSAAQQVAGSRAQFGATSFNDYTRLMFSSSLTGKDLLMIRLEAGNFSTTTNSFGGGGPSTLSTLSVAYQAEQGPYTPAVTRLYYQVPIGAFTFNVGSQLRQDTTLAINPSIYPKETVLDLMTFGGSIGAVNHALGTGAGVWWQRNGLAISSSYIALNGDNGNPSLGGIGSSKAGSTASFQVGYSGPNWATAATYSYVQNGSGVIPYATNFTLESFSQPGHTSGYGIGGYWQPLQSSWLPSISAGWGINSTTYNQDVNLGGLVRTSQSWSVGLQWQDAFRKGNVLGIAVAQPTFATSLYGSASADDGNFA